MNDIDPRAYLDYALPHIADHKVDRIDGAPALACGRQAAHASQSAEFRYLTGSASLPSCLTGTSISTGELHDHIGAFRWGDEGGWGTDFHKMANQRFDRSLDWTIIIEALLDENNRVVLDDTLKDDDGMAVPKMIYRNNEDAQRMTKFNVERAPSHGVRRGHFSCLRLPLRAKRVWHMPGTCLMGNLPSSCGLLEIQRRNRARRLLRFPVMLFHLPAVQSVGFLARRLSIALLKP
ncbi:MAG: hypothetical protein V4793_02060 [Paraburkholderia tropica]